MNQNKYQSNQNCDDEIDGSKAEREAIYGLKNPIDVFKIGIPISGFGLKDITNNAARFAITTPSKYANNPILSSGEGSQSNAFRHVLWQATITNHIGLSDAKRIGNAHEENPCADLRQRKFAKLSQADEVIDLLNNEIGRHLGDQYAEKVNMKLMAKAVLETFYKKGLYVAKPEGGIYIITREKLDEKTYSQFKDVLKKLDQNGFPEHNKHYNKDHLKQDLSNLDAVQTLKIFHAQTPEEQEKYKAYAQKLDERDSQNLQPMSAIPYLSAADKAELDDLAQANRERDVQSRGRSLGYPTVLI